MSKWTCNKCKSINAQFAPRCHNCGSAPAAYPSAELVKVAIGEIAHKYQGQCPEPGRLAQRDPECPACRTIETSAQSAPREEAMRDEVAIEAMKIFLQNALDHEIDFDGYESFEEMIADQAYLMADAMRNRSIQFTEPTAPTGERNE